MPLAGTSLRLSLGCTPRLAAPRGKTPPNRNAAKQRRLRLKAVEQEYLTESEGFSLAQVSFGTILAPIGVSLMVFGFGAYFSFLPGESNCRMHG